MDTKAAVLTILGVLLALLGTLWLVQGLGFVEVGPVLCVADCEPITGGSLRWTVVGAVALLAGVAIARMGLRRTNR